MARHYTSPRTGRAGKGTAVDPLIRAAGRIEAFLEKIGNVFAWIGLFTVLSIVLQVILRYVFGSGLIIIEELQWHFYGIGILMGLGYAYVHNAHVRVDLFHERFSPKVQAWIETIGILFLLFPFIWVIFYHSLPFVYESFRVNERSDAPAGLPYRFIIKGFIPLGFTLLFLSAVARLMRSIHTILGRS